MDVCKLSHEFQVFELVLVWRSGGLASGRPSEKPTSELDLSYIKPTILLHRKSSRIYHGSV